MGGETEYAIAATRGSEQVDQRALLRALMDFARCTMPYTFESPRGRFLRNGGLLYLDCGLHIEWASPECTSPHDVVRYLKAGDRVVETLAEQYARASPPADVFCTRCNVDYLASKAWASHESYLHRTDPERLPDQFIPFLASRLVLCGAGGWDYRSPGLSFTLSPRAGFITEVIADDTQHVRPLFHTKDERLSDTGSHRLHVSCSETLCSDLATLLRFGSTALVLAIVDEGASPGDGMALKSPLRALRRFAADPRCRAKVAVAVGRRLTAIDIQRHYLSAVEARLGTPCLPAWAESVCSLWRRTLDDLEARPGKLAGALDWAIKQRVYADFLRRHGVEWSSLPALNSALRRLSRTLASRGRGLHPEDLLSPNSQDAAMVGAWPDRTGDERVTREQLATVLRVRKPLFEIDMRFGELGDRGIFNALDRAGVLNHGVPGGVGDLDAAIDAPPRDTRAAVRGHVVQRLTEDGTRYRAEWTRVVDVDHRRVLNLGDPFEAVERWCEGA